MRSILYYILSKIKKLQNKNIEINTEISGIKQDITDINGNITNMIDSGTTDGINYIKYSDGTLIQYGSLQVTASDSRSSGGLTYYSGTNTKQLPFDFLDTNYNLFVSLPIANLNLFSQSYANINSVNTIQIEYLCTLQNDYRNIRFFAIGKWK